VASIKHDRVQAQIKQIVSNVILFELKDPRLGFVTVTRVELSSDMQFAKIFYSVLGSDVDTRLTAHAISHARGHVQSEIAKRLRRVRFIPRISFQYDDSPKKSIELAHLIDQAVGEDQQRRKKHGQAQAESEAGNEAGEEAGRDENPTED